MDDVLSSFVPSPAGRGSNKIKTQNVKDNMAGKNIFLVLRVIKNKEINRDRNVERE